MSQTPGRVRVAVLISGAGSNMAALIDAGQAADAPFEVVLVLSNDPEAGGLATASAKGVRTAAVDHRPFGKDRPAALIEDAVAIGAAIAVVLSL